MKLLDQKDINRKIKRIAIQILENHYSREVLFLAGINNNGYEFAKLLKTAIRRRKGSPEVELIRIKLNPAHPVKDPIEISTPGEDLNNQCIIVIDDVANTGRTLFYACKPLMSVLPSKVEVAVLVDRKHKQFPIKVDYMGISLATTVQDHISVKIKNVEEKEVHLE